MARTHEETIQAVREWKDFISSVDNIPLNPNHTYQDENNVYERLTEYVKDWAESVFGVYTNKNGELVSLPEDEEGNECKEWLQAVAGKVTPLVGDWYQVALKGAKNGAFSSLPQLEQRGLKGPDEGLSAHAQVNNAVQSTFFPAYRALRDSFSERSIFQWIFNHKQYTAERDARKGMTSLITSMTGCSKAELDVQYVQHKQAFTEEEIANFEVEYSNRAVNMREPEEEVALFKDEERFDKHIDLNNKRMEMGNDELFADEGRLDNYFYTDEDLEEIKNMPDPVDEPIVDYLPAEEKLEKFKEKEDIDEMCSKFMRAIKTTEENEDSIYRAMHTHLYDPLHKAAQRLCSIHDAMKFKYKGEDVEVLQGEEYKKEFSKLAPRSVRGMFETAFKALGAEDEREIVKTVNGKEVREKIGGSLFGITTLKDRLVAAQRITNMMLKHRTPVGFYPELSGNYAKSFHILENTAQVTAFLKENYANKYGESEIDTAVKMAKNVAAVKNRGEQPITYNVFEIGYRPDPWKLPEEQKMLGNAQKMMLKGLIQDETMKAIVNANVSKWKQARDLQNPKTKAKMDRVAIEKQWVEVDKKLAETYKDYEPAATENAVNSALEQYSKQKKEQVAINVDLNEPKAEIVPPVEQKPVEINAPKIEK